MLKLLRHYGLGLFALMVFGLELAMLTAWRGRFGSHRSAILFFLASILVGICGMIAASRSRNITKPSRWWVCIPALLLAIYAVVATSTLFPANPVNLSDSDVIPQTQELVTRLLEGEYPYSTIDFGSYSLTPTYLPLQWLPFCIAKYLNIDFRLLALVMFSLISLTPVLLLGKRLGNPALLTLTILPFFTILTVQHYAPLILIRTLETLIAGYYLLLAISLVKRSAIMVAVALACCLLSRYAVIFWAPLLLFIYWTINERRKALATISVCVGAILLIYVIPFLSRDWHIFTNSYAYHSKAALAEWRGQYWQQEGEKPYQLFRGLGLAGLYYDHAPGDVDNKLKWLQRSHLMLSIAAVATLAFIFFRNRKKIDFWVYSLAGLKIYLAVFYHMIQIPYDYLFLTLVMLSIPIVVVCLTRNISQPLTNEGKI